MAFSITQFQNNTTNQLSALDNNFTTFSALVPMPCGVAGTNTLTLAQNGGGLVPTIPIAAYTNGMIFTGVASATNTGAVTAQVGALPSLNVYKDTISGPVLLTGNEIVQFNAFSLKYDSSLNGSAGGFHLITATDGIGTAISPTSVQINEGTTLINWLSGNSPTLTFTATPGWSSQDQAFTLTTPAAAAAFLPAPGDFVNVVPTSLGAPGVIYQGLVTALGSLNSTTSVATVNVRLANSASTSLASNSGIYRYSIYRTVP